ncbi:MAG: DUF4349 domain-containing protein [Cyclobacteriaceae bacterium]|nr:DUF4349 domain-containing protein [Cyclobacteriaceae bacterium]
MIKLGMLPLVLLLLWGCSQKKSYDSYETQESLAEISAEPDNYLSSSAAKVSEDTTRKFIRTANIKFRVNNVRKATSRIEKITAKFDGFVTYTHLESQIERYEKVPVSADSSLESIYFNVENEIIIRVPNFLLDSMLNDLTVLVDYLDYRTIRAKDVTLSLNATQHKEKRLEEHTDRLKEVIDEKSRKLKETTHAEEELYRKNLQTDEAAISKLRMQDQIDFSTINLRIYQRPEIKRDLVENEKNIDAFQPGFLKQIGESVLVGWELLKSILLVLIKIWPVLLIVFIGWFGYRKYIK